MLAATPDATWEQADSGRRDRRAGGDEGYAVANTERVTLDIRVPRQDAACGERQHEHQRRPSARARERDRNERSACIRRPHEPGPRQPIQPFSNLIPRQRRVPGRGVFGDVEAAADEPLPDGPTAVGQKQQDGDGRIDGQSRARDEGSSGSHTTAQQHRERKHHERGADRPCLVPRHARRHEAKARACRRQRRASVEPVRGQHNCEEHGAE
jgi:hypothetical protein